MAAIYVFGNFQIIAALSYMHVVISYTVLQNLGEIQILCDFWDTLYMQVYEGVDLNHCDI